MFASAKNNDKLIKSNGRSIFALKIQVQVIILQILSIIFAVTAYSQPVLANQIDRPVRFSVKAIQSEKQANNTVSYFDLLLSPGEEHVLELDIFNNSDCAMDFTVGACTAGTNSGGVIDYDNIDVTDDSLKVSFAEIATVENPIISVPAKGSNRAAIKLVMPDESFDGIMLGGIVVKQAEYENNYDSENINSTSIQNEYCYIVGVRIRVNDSLVEPDFQLRNIEPMLSNQHTSIAVNLQNFNAALAKGVVIDANIYNENESQPLYSNSNNDFDVAPNSNFDYIIPCSGKLPAGDYRLLLAAAHGEKVWEFDERFTITAASANNINNKAVNIPSTNYYRIATICLSILLVAVVGFIVIWFILGRKKKSEKNNI